MAELRPHASSKRQLFGQNGHWQHLCYRSGIRWLAAVQPVCCRSLHGLPGEPWRRETDAKIRLIFLTGQARLQQAGIITFDLSGLMGEEMATQIQCQPDFIQ